MAFSYETKKFVKTRIGNSHSELSKRTDRPFEYIHLIHGKQYDKPEFCILTNDMEHLAHHLYWYDNPQKIGLTKSQNIWAINKIASRVTQFSFAQNRLHEYDEDISNCLNGWAIYYETHDFTC